MGGPKTFGSCGSASATLEITKTGLTSALQGWGRPEGGPERLGAGLTAGRHVEADVNKLVTLHNVIIQYSLLNCFFFNQKMSSSDLKFVVPDPGLKHGAIR
jgi:hypothetical protein